MFRYKYIEDLNLLVVRHYGEYIGAENQTAILDAYASLSPEHRASIRQILTDKSQVTHADLADTDRARIQFFYKSMQELMPTQGAVPAKPSDVTNVIVSPENEVVRSIMEERTRRSSTSTFDAARSKVVNDFEDACNVLGLPEDFSIEEAVALENPLG